MSAYPTANPFQHQLQQQVGPDNNHPHDLISPHAQDHHLHLHPHPHPHGLTVQPYPFDPGAQGHAQLQQAQAQVAYPGTGHAGLSIGPNGGGNASLNDRTDNAPGGSAADAQGNAGDAANAKGIRLRKACDSCSIRKVKCDESGPPCKACVALEIPCTFDRPSKRRGPPNKVAEAIKRRIVESPNGVATPSGFSSQSPTSPSNVAATLVSFSSNAVLSAESICPMSILELLVDDFFTYIHPLAPFPHEPSFRAAFRHREDTQNPGFLALLASMIGVLVASFPRKPMMHLKAQRLEKLFPNFISLVERCHKVAVEARGAGYLDRELTVYDAATSYFLGLAAAYTINWRQCRLYFGETFTISRVIGVQRQNTGENSTEYMGPDAQAQREPVDYIKQEIGRRIFWVMLVGIRSMQQLGADFAELVIPPPTPTNPYPPLPLEVDDQYIFVSHVDPQPGGQISKLTGFNLGIQIYMTCTPLATLDLTHGVDQLFDWPRQKHVLEECLAAVKETLRNIPRELMLEPGREVGEFENQGYGVPGAQSHYFAHGDGQAYRDSQRYADPRRQIQYEIQKANIYASQLGTRSYVVEKYWNLLDAHNRVLNRGKDFSSSPSTGAASGPAATEGLTLDGMLKVSKDFDEVEMHFNAEREAIVKDLLRVLASISQVNMEPNGSSFINKIRQIASTLLDTPRNHKGPLALKAEDYLGRFLDVLVKLEKMGPSRQSGEFVRDRNELRPEGRELGPPQAGDRGLGGEGERKWVDEDEEELQTWADLREYQQRFARNGGFLGEF